MDGTKLDLTEKGVTTNTPATYKVIPETNMEEAAINTRSKSISKSKGEADGADEKMLPKEDKIDTSDVKVVATNEKQNGDAKLDIGDLKHAAVGLTKEELMKYANDPFWVRLRWFLFITFWLLWGVMLLGAVLIIYSAPKCNPPPPRTWWEEGPITESHDTIELEQLKSLKDNGVKGIIVSWPEDAYALLNDSHRFVKLLNDSKLAEIKVIVELEPGISKKWLKQSKNKEEGLEDYYIWKSSKFGASEAPNHWLTHEDKSAWTYASERNEYYYSRENGPLLNFRNPNVTEQFSNVIRKFLAYGAAGIRIRGVPYLLVDSKFEEEPISISPSSYTVADSVFFKHSKTENLLELGALLQQWRTIVKNVTETGPLMAVEHLSNIAAYKNNNLVMIDLPVQSLFLTNSTFNTTHLVEGLDSIFKGDNISWPLWKYNGNDAIDMVTYLLPGVPLISTKSPVNPNLLDIRKKPSIMRGGFNYYTLVNNTVFAFVREVSGNPGALIAFNPTNKTVIVDFPEKIAAVTDEVTVQLFSSRYNEPNIALNVKYDAHHIPISANSTIVLFYVPKSRK